METPTTEAPVTVPAPAVAVAPVPLTAVPAAETTAAPAEPRVKRKYTKRAAKWTKKDAAPKKTGKKAKTEKKAKPAKKAKAEKTEKKAKRVAGTKAQGQVPKVVMKFIKAEAKEQDITVGSLVGTILTGYATRRGLDLDA